MRPCEMGVFNARTGTKVLPRKQKKRSPLFSLSQHISFSHGIKPGDWEVSLHSEMFACLTPLSSSCVAGRRGRDKEGERGGRGGWGGE